MIRKLWIDSDGGIITTELVLVASFVTATLLGGLSVLKSRISSEFVELAEVVETARDGQSIEPVVAAEAETFGVEIAGDADEFFKP